MANQRQTQPSRNGDKEDEQPIASPLPEKNLLKLLETWNSEAEGADEPEDKLPEPVEI